MEEHLQIRNDLNSDVKKKVSGLAEYIELKSQQNPNPKNPALTLEEIFTVLIPAWIKEWSGKCRLINNAIVFSEDADVNEKVDYLLVPPYKFKSNKCVEEFNKKLDKINALFPEYRNLFFLITLSEGSFLCLIKLKRKGFTTQRRKEIYVNVYCSKEISKGDDEEKLIQEISNTFIKKIELKNEDKKLITTELSKLPNSEEISREIVNWIKGNFTGTFFPLEGSKLEISDHTEISTKKKKNKNKRKHNGQADFFENSASKEIAEPEKVSNFLFNDLIDKIKNNDNGNKVCVLGTRSFMEKKQIKNLQAEHILFTPPLEQQDKISNLLKDAINQMGSGHNYTIYLPILIKDNANNSNNHYIGIKFIYNAQQNSAEIYGFDSLGICYELLNEAMINIKKTTPSILIFIDCQSYQQDDSSCGWWLMMFLYQEFIPDCDITLRDLRNSPDKIQAAMQIFESFIHSSTTANFKH